MGMKTINGLTMRNSFFLLACILTTFFVNCKHDSGGGITPPPPPPPPTVTNEVDFCLPNPMNRSSYRNSQLSLHSAHRQIPTLKLK